MKIIKYEKRKNGMYQVFFDNGNNVDLHENIILNNNLLIKKEASVSEIDEMLDQNKKYIAYNLAIKYISVKMRSKKEISLYLSKKGIDKSTIDEVVELLIKEKYVDDFSYARAFVNDRILLSMDGPNKIRGKLEDLGISDSAIEDALSSFTSELQKERIEKISNKQVNINRNKSANVLKNKIATYLFNLGYNREIIMSVVNSLKFTNDDSIAKKEYDKLYKRLSRKYSGSELDYMIKKKMYALGFTDYKKEGND